MSFGDSLHGWAVGCNGLAERTTNGGSDWLPVTNLPNVSWSAVHFVTALKGWIGGGSVDIYSTTDGGQTWNDQIVPDQGVVTSFVFADSLHGWINGCPIYYTSDGGQTWTRRENVCSVTLSAVSATEAWEYEGNYDIQHTTDAGLTWESRLYSLRAQNMKFADPMHGWVARSSGPSDESVWSTMDGGTVWNRRLTVDSSDSYEGLYVLDSLNVWVAMHDHLVNGAKSFVLHTADGGGSWDTVNVGISFGDLAIVDPRHIWAMGPDNSIRRFIPPAPSAVHPVGAPVPQLLSLSAYPNPFNPTTTLLFDLPRAGRARLTIYDVEGRLVRTLADEVLTAGRHLLEFDGSQLSSGVYFARLESAALSRTQKLVLLK